MIYITIDVVKDMLISNNPIKKSRVYGENTVNKYKLLNTICIKLTNGMVITIPEGFIWDLASVPRLFWSICPPDTDAEIAYLIHDYLYENKTRLNITKNFTDLEMYKWSVVTNGTKKISIRNLDNQIRYYMVKWFGKKLWKS